MNIDIQYSSLPHLALWKQLEVNKANFDAVFVTESKLDQHHEKKIINLFAEQGKHLLLFVA